MGDRAVACLKTQAGDQRPGEMSEECMSPQLLRHRGLCKEGRRGVHRSEVHHRWRSIQPMAARLEAAWMLRNGAPTWASTVAHGFNAPQLRRLPIRL